MSLKKDVGTSSRRFLRTSKNREKKTQIIWTAEGSPVDNLSDYENAITSFTGYRQVAADTISKNFCSREDSDMSKRKNVVTENAPKKNMITAKKNRTVVDNFAKADYDSD
ncbi:unnamed protein product [marine sediment metagenome]|uniref:Uncharacterized protein n=1 Tax=marine sediment metagenome TaxID=412755 RepID=X1LHQ2_9ZZZZ